MGLSGAGGAAFHTLRLASSSSAALVRRCRTSLPRGLLPAAAARTAGPSALRSRRFLRRSSPPFRRFVRAFSGPALQDTPVPTQEQDRAAGAAAGKPRWKAAIDFKWIRDNKDEVAANIKNRNSTADLELVLELYEKYCDLLKEVERLRAERNAVANRMKGKLELPVRLALVEEGEGFSYSAPHAHYKPRKRRGKELPAHLEQAGKSTRASKNKGKNLKEGLIALEEDLVQITDRLQLEAQCIPNITHPAVPIGGEESSVVRKLVGSQRSISFPAKDHVQIGKELDLFDFDAAAEVSGSKFYYLKNEAVLLEMALVNWAISEVSRKGFTPLITPEIVRSTVVEKCGFQPRGQNSQVYSVEGSDRCLIGTAEIPVGGIHMDSILSDSSLPLKYVAHSHCFRTEAGAAGTATRGLYRVHQFSKVEMFIFCRPEDSDFYHEELIGIEEDLFASLGLHFKTLDMATGDLGAPAYRKFDVEAWMPGLGRYGEISSASNCTDYQSRRLNIRCRPSLPDREAAGPKKGKGSNTASTQFVHTLNATACAVPRMIVCLLENFQQEDGSVIIPEPLRPFMGGLEVISPKIK